MGKTIALKLTKDEEQIIAQFNKQGITNSELLRSALRLYFNHIHGLSDNAQIKNIFLRNEPKYADFSVTLGDLKHEMLQLREQMKETQKQVENTLAAFQRRLYLVSVKDPLSHQIPLPLKLDIIYDIHQQVDDFLNKEFLKTSETAVIR